VIYAYKGGDEMRSILQGPSKKFYCSPVVQSFCKALASSSAICSLIPYKGLHLYQKLVIGEQVGKNVAEWGELLETSPILANLMIAAQQTQFPRFETNITI